MSAATIAAPGCEACGETGKVDGFGHAHGQTCPCVARCFECGASIAWEHDDCAAPFFCKACETAQTLESAS